MFTTKAMSKDGTPVIFGTLQELIKHVQEATPQAMLRDATGLVADVPVATWEQQVYATMSDQRWTCECHGDYRPEETIFNHRAHLYKNKIVSGETGHDIYTVIG